ncbi:MAG: cupin domain-containing protein [Candidatus Nitrosocaldaceae archaeon]
MIEHYDIDDIISKMNNWYETFISKPNMAVGVLRLRADELDPQDPHLYDEIYYIIKGDGYITIEDEVVDIKEGSIIFVPAYAKHKFHSKKELIAIYVFAGEDKDVSEVK